MCIAGRSRSGWTRAPTEREVETELIEPVLGLSEDDRAALWLFAWAYHENASRTGHPPAEVVTR
jgi:hypothetical protein